MRSIALRFLASVKDLTAEKIVLILVVGLVVGVFPVFGAPTALCALAAVALRLNLPAIQLVNQLSSPLQYTLLIPLAQLGARICGAPSAPWNIATAALHAVIGWFCVCVPLGIVLHLTLSWALRAQAGKQDGRAAILAVRLVSPV